MNAIHWCVTVQIDLLHLPAVRKQLQRDLFITGVVLILINFLDNDIFNKHLFLV